jgi:hypothetical protein
MAQTTDAMSSANYKVEVSSNGTAWTDISGAGATVSVDGGEIGVGSQHTAAGAEAVVVSSKKRAPRTVNVRCLYTETAGEPWKVVNAAYLAADPKIYVRFSPNGGADGDLRYTTSIGGVAAAVPIVTCGMPELDAGSEDPAMFEFSVMAPGLLEETIAS